MNPNRPKITPTEALNITMQAQLLVREFYVHLPQKESSRAVRPLQELQLLRREIRTHIISQRTGARVPAFNSDDFHHRMFDVFNKLRDGHTFYSTTTDFDVALVPFHIRRFFDDGEVTYVALGVEAGHEPFQNGVVITHWNQVPIEIAINLYGAMYYGSNAEASFIQGMEFITRRPLSRAAAPIEESVNITFQWFGRSYSKKFDWQPGYLDELEEDMVRLAPYSYPQEETDDQRRYDPHLVAIDTTLNAARNPQIRHPHLTPAAAAAIQVTQIVANAYFYIEKLSLNGTVVIYARLRSFILGVVEPFVEQLRTVISQNDPIHALCIDIRKNPGGNIEKMQVLARAIGIKDSIELQVRTTDGMFELVNNVGLYQHFAPSLNQAELSGEDFSRMVNISDPGHQAEIELPRETMKILIVDPLSVSASDMFAALFRESLMPAGAPGQHRIYGYDGNRTGGSGGSPQSHDSIASNFPDLYGSTDNELPNPGDPQTDDLDTFLEHWLSRTTGFIVYHKTPFYSLPRRNRPVFRAVDATSLAQYEVRIEIRGKSGEEWFQTHWYRLSSDASLLPPVNDEHGAVEQIEKLYNNVELLDGSRLNPNLDSLSFEADDGVKRVHVRLADRSLLLDVDSSLPTKRPIGLSTLPQGTSIQVTVLRSLLADSRPLEDFGVKVDHVYQPTFNDLIDRKRDLKAKLLDDVKSWHANLP